MATEREYNVEYWTQQEQLYLKLLKEEPAKAVMSHLGLACCYEIMSRYDDCFLHCNKALELKKNDLEAVDAYVWMGRACQAQKEYNAAIAHFMQAVEVDPEHDAAIEDIAACYLELKDYANAEHWYGELGKIEGMEDSAWIRLGDLFYEQKDFDRALTYYEKALAVSEKDFEGLCGKGRCLAEKKRYAEAIDIFKHVTSLYPDQALPWYYAGLAYQETNDQYRAMHQYMKALELDPSFAEVYNNVGKLYADFDGDIKTAIDYLEKALEHVDNTRLKQMIYINLTRLNNRIADYERGDYYKSKLLDELGFGGLFSLGDEDEDGEDRDEPDDE